MQFSLNLLYRRNFLVEERAWSTEERETEGLLKDEEQFGSADHDHADGRSGRKTNGDQSAGSRRHSRRPPTAKFSTPKEKPTPVQPVQDYQATGSKQQRLVEKKQEQKQQQTHQSPSLARRSAAKLETNRAITYDFEMKDKLVHKYHTCMDIATCIYSYMHAID